MKSTLTLFFILLFNVTRALSQHAIISTDIDNFWNAYDHIITTQDTVEQYRYLNDLFISKGTPGLKAIMQVRDYTPQSYLKAIHNYPLFWQSIRENTLKATKFSSEINHGIAQLRRLYPELRPAIIYFTIGALRTNGTTQKNRILIGSELALADSATITSEFPPALNHLKTFFRSNPIQSVVFGNVHEYVHTQQKTTVASTLLGQCILEGVAEFLAVKATNHMSTAPALTYGPAHDSRIKALFEDQIFNPTTGFWLYNNQTNEFGVRDLGYYVGYAICERYYHNALNKQQAIKEIIELDYNNEADLMRFVDHTGYFGKPLPVLRNEYEINKPIVTGVDEIGNPSVLISPAITTLTVRFSKPMNTRTRGFDFGPAGEGNALKLKRFIGFSEDGTSVSFEVELKPNRHYQLLLTERFQDLNGKPLKPYLIDFNTSSQN